MTIFWATLVAGVTIGSIYAIVGIGFTVIFNATRVFNLAQGALVMVGIMMSYYTLVVLNLNQALAALAVISTVVALAVFEEKTVVRPFLNKQGPASFGWFIATLGFGLVVSSVVIVAFGNRAVVPVPSPFPVGAIHLGSLAIGYQQLFIIVSFVLIILALAVFYQRTWMGQAMRGTAEDREAASLLGINPSTMSRTSFMLAGLVSAVAGFAIAPLTFSNPTVGLNFTLLGFLALAIGGFGSILGAVVGGILLGVAQQLCNTYISPDYEILTGLVLVLLIASWRPSGIFNSATIRNV